MKIINGKLDTITTHSGHYQPSLKAVKYILEYLHNKGVDIQSVWVETFMDLRKHLPHVKSVCDKINSRRVFRTQACNLFGPMTNILKTPLQEAEKLFSQQEQSFATRFFQVKDVFICSNLTAERNRLRQSVREGLLNFPPVPQTPQAQYSKLQNTMTRLSDYIAADDALSKACHAKPGRLHRFFRDLKAKLEPIYADAYIEVFSENKAADKVLATLH